MSISKRQAPSATMGKGYIYTITTQETHKTHKYMSCSTSLLTEEIQINKTRDIFIAYKISIDSKNV